MHVDNPELAVHAIHSQIILSISIHRKFFSEILLISTLFRGLFPRKIAHRIVRRQVFKSLRQGSGRRLSG